MEEPSLIATINHEMGIELAPQLSFEQLRAQLQAVISKMIVADFQQLVNVLYRIDVNERKLKYLLQENVGEDAAVIIADLIIERQLEKIKSRRQQFNQPDEDLSGEEKW